MRTAILFVLVSSTAQADPPRECTPGGGVLFEVDQQADHGLKLVSATTKLYGNGAWRTEWLDVDGKVSRTAVGCLVQSSVDRVRDDLRAAKWAVTHHQIACRISSPRFTTYKWNGRTLFTDRICNSYVLDDKSRQVLESIDYTVDVPDDLDGPGIPRRQRGDPPRRRGGSGVLDMCNGVLCK